MKQYLGLLKDIMKNGEMKEPARAGMPRTKEVFCRSLTFNLQEGFPLITTKKMYIKGFLSEILWILKGNTNIADLVKNGVNTWTKDAYKYYTKNIYKSISPEAASSIEDFTEMIRNMPTWDNNTFLGSTGHSYGHQWRKWNGTFDQIKWVLNNIKENPNSRYHLLTTWNPTDFLQFPENAALPSCHIFAQFSVRTINDKRYLDLMFLQRSCDMFLGVPFDIAMYAILCHIFANKLDMLPGNLTFVGNSCHIYENHFEQVKVQLKRKPLKLPTLVINKKLGNIDDISLADFDVVDYMHYEKIVAPLNVGI